MEIIYLVKKYELKENLSWPILIIAENKSK